MNPLGFVTTVMGGDLADPARGGVNAARLALAIQGAEAAQQRDVPYVIIVGDKGERGEDLQRIFRGYNAYVFPENEIEDRAWGMFHARQQALRLGLEVLNADVQMWIEPEKVAEFLRDLNYGPLMRAVRAIQDGTCQAITPNCRAMIGYPSYQQETERRADERIAEATGLRPYDAFRGPFGGNQAVIRHMLTYQGEYGTKHTTTCVLQQLRVLQGNMDVGIFHLPNFRYPDIQRLTEEGNPNIQAIRDTQEKLADQAIRLVSDSMAAGKWPPPGDLIELS